MGKVIRRAPRMLMDLLTPNDSPQQFLATSSLCADVYGKKELPSTRPSSDANSGIKE